jgi:hypothetical protein
VGVIKEYDLADIATGELHSTNVHILIIDMSDPAIIDCADVLEMLVGMSLSASCMKKICTP